MSDLNVESGAVEKARRLYRALELSAAVMRDPARTGGWEGSERTASAFERQARSAKELHDMLAAHTPARPPSERQDAAPMPSDPKNAAAGELREALEDAVRGLRRARWAYETAEEEEPSAAWVALDAAYQRGKAALATPPDPAASQGDAARAATDGLRELGERLERGEMIGGTPYARRMAEQLLALSTRPSASGEAGLTAQEQERLAWIDTELAEDHTRPLWGGPDYDGPLMRNGHEITQLELEAAQLRLKSYQAELAANRTAPRAWLRDAQSDAEDEALIVCAKGDPGSFPVFALTPPTPATEPETQTSIKLLRSLAQAYLAAPHAPATGASSGLTAAQKAARESWAWHEPGEAEGPRLDRAVCAALAAARRSPVDGDDRAGEALTPEQTFQQAQALAAEVGYVLTPEPQHPDSPHAIVTSTPSGLMEPEVKKACHSAGYYDGDYLPFRAGAEWAVHRSPVDGDGGADLSEALVALAHMQRAAAENGAGLKIADDVLTKHGFELAPHAPVRQSPTPEPKP